MLTQAVLSYVIIISLSFHHSFLPSFPLPALLSILGTAAGFPRFRSRRWCREVCTGRLIQWCAAEYRNCSRVSFCGSQVLIPPGSIKFSRYTCGYANGMLIDGRPPFCFGLFKSPDALCSFHPVIKLQTKCRHPSRVSASKLFCCVVIISSIQYAVNRTWSVEK